MSQSLVLLSLLYAAAVFLALALLLRTRLAVPWKTLLLLAYTGLAILSYDGWQQMAGWPADAPLPDRFLYQAATVHEPDSARHDPGVIHIWATALGPDGPAPEPRAYALPYSKADHEQIQAARERMLQEGLPQIGRLNRGREGNGHLAVGRQAAGVGATFTLADLPEPALPEK